VLITPGRKPGLDTLVRILSAADRKTLNAYTSNLPFDLTPPTDDRPFFFNQLPLSRPFQALAYASNVLAQGAQGGGVRQGNFVATLTLLILFCLASLLVAAAIVIPLRSALNEVGAALAVRGTLYFALIGIGFMLVEVGLLQRMSVFLGHPIYSLSVLLFTLILTTGFGSFLSERLVLADRSRIASWAILTGAYLLVLPFLLAVGFAGFNDAGLAVRIAVSVAIIVPAGILLGFGFPTGIRLIAAINSRPTPWFWGINGAAGVLASIAAVGISLAFGITATLMLGGLCYLMVLPASLTLIQHQQTTVSKKRIRHK
jgi:hypothetical protein